MKKRLEEFNFQAKNVFNFINKYKIKIGVSLIVILITFSLLILNKSPEFNKYIASLIYHGQAANSSFDDINFYNSIIDAYNSEKGTSLSYTHNLTDEELSSITILDSHQKGISSTKGLEKLTGLTNLNLLGNNINEIDVSNNPNLTSLNLKFNKLIEIDVSNLTELEELNLYDNNLSKIDLSNNPNLTILDLNRNNLSEIDLSNNSNLTILDLNYNNLSEIDLSELINLTNLSLAGNKFESINFTDASKENLVYLNLADNYLTEIDLAGLESLQKLYLNENKLSNIILGNTPNLQTFHIYNNNLTSLNLSNISSLKNFIGYMNKFETISLPNGFSLNNDSLYEKFRNKGNNAFKYFNLGDNRIISISDDYKFYINTIVINNDNITIDEFINNLGLNNLTAEIYNNDEIITSGFVEEGYVLKIKYDETVIQTTTIYKKPVNSSFDDPVFYNSIIDAYNKEKGTSLPYTHNLTDEELSSITVLKATYDDINSTKGLEKLTGLTNLNLAGNNINEIDVSSLEKLTYLKLDQNFMNKINLEGLNNLIELYLGVNSFDFINITNFENLKILDLSYNRLKSVELSNLPNLENLYLNANNLSEINLSDLDNLKGFKLDSIKLFAKIDLIVGKNGYISNIYFPSKAFENSLVNVSDYDEEIVSFENNKFIGLKPGVSRVNISISDEDMGDYELINGVSLVGIIIVHDNSETQTYYEVNFDANGGNGTMDSVLSEQIFKLPKNKFIRYGYEFVNWNTSNDGTGETYTDEQEITLNDDITLYAQWRKINVYETDTYEVDKENRYINKININTDLNEFKLNFRLNSKYEIEVDTKEVDGKNVLYTGGKTKVIKDSIVYEEYKNVVLGDTNGDGKISYMDYVKVYNHIRKQKNPEINKNLLENEYLKAGDMSGDNNITYMDYVKIYNKIRDLKGE